jgi:LysM repeat protein
VVVPVKLADPDADGKVFHVVEPGQSFWSIAVAYQITINDLEVWNNLSSGSSLRIGQRLFIPGSNTEGYSTPTPVGMFAISTPDVDGRIVHEVAAYQTLTSISQSYGVDMAAILALNGIQQDWPLQVGQQLVISAGSVTPSPTPRPLTPIEKLTPASDGLYYHEITGGQTLSGIARIYQLPVNDLMNWNGLNASSTIYSGQRLLLMVTPPATPTRTPGPATATRIPPTATATLLPTRIVTSPTAAVDSLASNEGNPLAGYGLIVLAALGLGAAAYFLGKRRILRG